jgi:glutamate formiminotransferase/glutamate formiminotransferase/formiminotetrahydrofolate cyclodeaminase
MTSPILLAVPNVSEGRDASVIDAIGQAFERGRCAEGATSKREAGTETVQSPVRLLDVHSDGDHHRSVFTLAGHPNELADALLRGTQTAIQQIDVMTRTASGGRDAGQHPHVGAVDVVPLVFLDPESRGAACAAALVVADRIGFELEVPVFLYGELAGNGPGSGRAELRRGGVVGLAERMAPSADAGSARRPDFGPPRMHPTAGATLVAAREPLVAFNLQLQEPATVEDARRVAALIREGGADGLPGVRAIGVSLEGHVAQVSMNVERPLEVSLAAVLAAVARHAPVASAELVGLAPRAALRDFPEDVPMPGFDPARHVIENALGS